MDTDVDDGIAPPSIEYPEPPPRRGRHALEADICRVFDLYLADTITTDGKPLTPHRVGRKLMELDGLSHKPSTGGISGAMQRMADAGFIQARKRPFAFVAYTDEGQQLGWDRMREASAA